MMNLTLVLLPESFAICRLQSDSPFPDWAQGDFISITRTVDELSVVCQQDLVPADVQSEAGWRCLRVAGKLEFSLIGIIASISRTLSEAGISVFVVSSFDTDFVLVKEENLKKAMQVLEEAGHRTENQSVGEQRAE